jgi:hypothetical protein
MDHVGNGVLNNSSIVACVFTAPVAFLLNRRLATTEDTHMEAQTDGRYL